MADTSDKQTAESHKAVSIHAQTAELLGPVVHYWLHLLYQHIRYFDDGDTVFLFCARAGVRMQKLYRTFLESKGFESDVGDLLWISRAAACKAVFSKQADLSVQTIQGEFLGSTLEDLLQCLTRNDECLNQLVVDNASEEIQGLSADRFSSWIENQTESARAVRNYLLESSRDFESALAGLIGPRRRVVLIDTGWQGTTQKLLSKAFPRVDWKGLYFGRISEGPAERAANDEVIGLVFDSPGYDPSKPETAFTLHRHLIEGLFETNAPSIEEVRAGEVLRSSISANQLETPDPVLDATYIGVAHYVAANGGLSLAQVHARYQAAMEQLGEIICTPTAADVGRIATKARSADFGKALVVPVVLSPADYPDMDQQERLDRALWYQGQVALEYPRKYARDLQERSIGLTNSADYFFSPARASRSRNSTVAIITRTKNRPVLLRRAAESVARQTHTDFVWVVVNDGGDPEVVDEVLDSCFVEKSRIVRIDHPESLGMEAASNAGIRAVESEFILIHDDDDSLEPTFLEKTVGFLESQNGAKYRGVVTKSEYVSEEIIGDKVVTHSSHPFMDWVSEVQLAEMATANFFPPIAFLYRRDMWDRIGGYCEDLPVFGDWKFNLDFLSRADIGFLPERLAFYHHRDRLSSISAGSYSNSVQGGRSKHIEYASIVRNMCIRDRDANPILADLMASAYLHRSTRHHAEMSVSRLARPEPEEVPEVVNDWEWIIKNLRGSFFVSKGRAIRILRWLLLAPGRRIQIDPSFDEATYLANNPDVRDALDKGQITSGYEHYLFHGVAESRPRPTRK